jgi:hypothetical protein
MQLLESTFFMDMFSFSFSNLKKSEFERIRKAFKMKIESKDEGFYNCSIEINQKGKFYFDENKENYFIFLH